MGTVTSFLRLDRMKVLRHQMQRDSERVRAALETIQHREEMVAGSVFERRRRCGKRGCRCEQGKLHVGQILSVRRAGQPVWTSMNASSSEMTVTLVGNYQRFRKARRELMQTFQRLIEAVDELGCLKLKES